MGGVLKELLVKLVELQKLELEAEKIRRRQKNLPIRLTELDEEFKVLRDAIERSRNEFEDKQKLKREKDRQLQVGQEAMKKTRDRLSEVKTNKEYQSMLKEIESSEKKNGKIEEEIISLLDGIESASREMKQQEGDFETSCIAYEDKKRELHADVDSLQGRLEELLRDVETMRKDISPDLLKRYDRIKAFANGVAVVPVQKEICSGCHMAIPPQMYNELQTGSEILTCPNCNRIIFRETVGA
jgi:predicted  nucleic acid-binding Zn-ribbon protein